MPRTFKCKTCGIVNEPLTGNHCQHRDDHLETENLDNATLILPLMRNIGERMDAIDQRMDSMQSTGVVESIASETGEAAAAIEEVIHATDDLCNDPASPATLRKDRRLMEDATRRNYGDSNWLSRTRTICESLALQEQQVSAQGR